jgi:hypothetical protein
MSGVLPVQEAPSDTASCSDEFFEKYRGGMMRWNPLGTGGLICGVLPVQEAPSD